MGSAGFDGGVGGEGGSHALRRSPREQRRCSWQMCAQKWQSLSQPPPYGQRPPGEKAPPKSTQIKHPNKAPNPSPSPLEGPGAAARQEGVPAAPV